MDSNFKVGAFYLTSYASLLPGIFLTTRIIKRAIETPKTGNQSAFLYLGPEIVHPKLFLVNDKSVEVASCYHMLYSLKNIAFSFRYI